MEVYARLSTAGSNTDGTTKFESDIVPLSSRGLHLIIEGIFLALFTGVWTGMRLWCRRMKKVPISIEDWLHLTALFFFYGQVVTCFISVSMGGAGHHVNELQPWHIVRFYKAIFAIQVLYALGVGFVKISITVMLMRIFVTRRVRIAGSFIIFISALWIVLTILVGLLLCKPIQQNWNMNAGGTCGNQYAGFGVVAAVDIFNEICLLILPIPSVLNLHIHNRYKVALAGVFGTGIITLVVAALRIPILLQTDFLDLTYDTRSQMAALAEPAVAIIISCSPLLKPLFDKVFTRLLGTLKGDSSQNESSAMSQSVGRINQAHKIRGSQGYSRFDDSKDLIEMRDMNLQTTTQETEVTTSGHRSVETYEPPGIFITRETIISHND